MALCTFTPIKRWQGIVEIALRMVCIVLVVLTFICSIAATASLSAPRTPIEYIEDLRQNTRSPVGWLLVLEMVGLPVIVTVLVLRFLDIRILVDNIKIILVVDIFICGGMFIGFFCAAVPLAVDAENWRYWMDRGTAEEVKMYGLNRILHSVRATSFFSFISSFFFIVLALWIIITLLFGWSKGDQKSNYTPNGLTPKVTMVRSNSDEIAIVHVDVGEEKKENEEEVTYPEA